MKVDITSMFFNSKIEGKTATPAWRTSIGQNKSKECRIETEVPGVSDMIIGMTYMMQTDLDNLDKKDVSGELMLCAFFDKVFVNSKRVKGAKYTLLLLRETSDSHEGRLQICYAPKITYKGISNSSNIDKIRESLGCSADGCWFVYEISIKNQDELHFSAVVVDANQPALYKGTSQDRSRLWRSLLPSGEDISTILFQSKDATKFVWECLKYFSKNKDLEKLFNSGHYNTYDKYDGRSYIRLNDRYCIIAKIAKDGNEKDHDNISIYDGRIINDDFYMSEKNQMEEFISVINEVYKGKYKIVQEGEWGEAIFKLLSALDEPRQQIFFGAPGTGKSYRVEQITEQFGDDVIRTTFHPDSDYSTFVGCYKPTMQELQGELTNQPILDYDSLVDKFKEYLNVPNANITKACTLFGYHYHNSIVRMQEQGRRITDLVNDAYKSNTSYDSVVRGGMACYEEERYIPASKTEIAYSFVPQAFTQAYTRAWLNLSRPIFLVIEELNRGNCAQIFGDIFQLLDRNDKNESAYSIIPDNDLQKHLADQFKDADNIPADIQSGLKMRLPSNLYIWATMNTSDQSLFPIDSAFKRRWIWKYIPIANAELDYKIQVGDNQYDWWSFVEKVNNEIEGATKSEDKKLGYFFAKAENEIIPADTFVSKVVFYLWNDVFKDSYDKTIFKDGLTFHRFFEPNGDPKLEIIDTFLHDLDLKAFGEE